MTKCLTTLEHSPQDLRIKKEVLLRKIRRTLKRSSFILSLFLLGNLVMHLLPLTVGGWWYIIQGGLDLLIFLFVIFLSKGLVQVELSIISLISFQVNLMTLDDYNNNTNLVYDNYPDIMTFLYWGAITAIVIYTIRSIYPILEQLINEYRNTVTN